MRTVNRVLAVVVTIALLFAAVVFAIELIASRAGAGPVVVDWHSAYSWLATRTWADTSVRITIALCTLAGLALLVAQLLRRRPDRLRVAGGEAATDAAITRRSLVRSVQQAVGDIDGISRARVRLRGNRITVDARRRAEVVEDVDREAVADTTRRAVDELRLRRPPRVSVTLATAKER